MSQVSETSYGIIPIHIEKEDPKILIVKKANGHFWSFPKGHPHVEDQNEKKRLKESC